MDQGIQEEIKDNFVTLASGFEREGNEIWNIDYRTDSIATLGIERTESMQIDDDTALANHIKREFSKEQNVDTIETNPIQESFWGM